MTAGADAVLRLHARGFTATERLLLEGAVKVSQRRPPRIELVEGAQAVHADVVMVDVQDPQAAHWAATQPWLAAKAVIWAGAATARPGHMAIERHVKWPILPVLLYRALEQRPRAADATPAAATASRAPAAATRRVLVVDDSLAARAHLRSLLERQGLEVAECERAEDGIAAAARESFACVLLDVLMPGMDGLEACRRIKAGARNGSPQPVVMLTSKSSPFDRVRGKMAGCDSYLTKPVDAAELHAVLARWLAPPAGPAFPRHPISSHT